MVTRQIKDGRVGVHYLTQLSKSVVDGGFDVGEINCPFLKGPDEGREDSQDSYQDIDGSNEFYYLDFAESTCYRIFILKFSQRLQNYQVVIENCSGSSVK